MDIRISSPNKEVKRIEISVLDNNVVLLVGKESKGVILEFLSAAQELLSGESFPYSYIAKDLLHSASEIISEAEGE